MHESSESDEDEKETVMNGSGRVVDPANATAAAAAASDVVGVVAGSSRATARNPSFGMAVGDGHVVVPSVGLVGVESGTRSSDDGRRREVIGADDEERPPPAGGDSDDDDSAMDGHQGSLSSAANESESQSNNENDVNHRVEGAVATPSGSSAGDDPSQRRSRWVTSFREAAQCLRENRHGGGGLRSLVVVGPVIQPLHANDDDEEEDLLDGNDLADDGAQHHEIVADRRAAFTEFVHELGKSECDLRGMTVSDMDWRGLREAVVDRFFGEVVPKHPTLEGIQFYDSDIAAHRAPSNALALLASAMPRTSPLTSLRWGGSMYDHDTAIAIADMIRRDPINLQHLGVFPPQRDVGIDPQALKTICDALPYNTHLRGMHIRPDTVLVDSLDGALGRTSPLKYLHVFSLQPYTCQAVTGIAERLKSNSTLISLYLFKVSVVPAEQVDDWRPCRMDEDVVFRPLRDALDKYNFALRYLKAPMYLTFLGNVVNETEGYWSKDAAVTYLLDRNTRILRVLETLEVPSSSAPPDDPGPTQTACSSTRAAEAKAVIRPSPSTQPHPQSYHTQLPGLWPLFMAVSSDIPTPMYRLLRWGALKDVCDCIPVRVAARGSRKRGRRALSADGDDVGDQ